MSKKVEWVNKSKMLFNSGNKSFDRQVLSITKGNSIGGGVTSNGIRSFNETVGPVGQKKQKGFFQSYDLKSFSNLPINFRDQIVNLTMDESALLYEFYHYRSNSKIVHGWFLMRDGKVLKRFDALPLRAKSCIVLDEAVKYICDDYDKDGNHINKAV